MGEAVGARRYEFVVASRLSPSMLAAFDELAARHDRRGTVLSGVVHDDDQFDALLERFAALGVEVEFVVQLNGRGPTVDIRRPSA